jgi:predicted TPR repeat methyltransferase
MELAPNDVQTARAYAKTVSSGSDVRAAIDAWRNVLRIVPDAAVSHAALVQLYLKAGDARSARQHEEYLRLLEQWQWRKEHREDSGPRIP